MDHTKDTKSHFNWGIFFLGVLFVVASIISLTYPGMTLTVIVSFFAVATIAKGIFEMTVRRSLISDFGGSTGWSIALGIIEILLGIYLLFNLTIGLTVLPYIFAAWFIFDSVANIFISQMIKGYSKGYFYFSLIISIIGIILGIYLLLNPITSALTLSTFVGFYFMMIGSLLIVEAFG